MKKLLSIPVLALLFCVLTFSAWANVPCGGQKGGIAQCQGDTFVCNDGSVSASRKSCLNYIGGDREDSSARRPMSFSKDGQCDCRSGQYCVGPRGGIYCFSDDGRKSYQRK